MGNKRLCKAEKGKKICGVCLGIANYLNIDVTLVRIIWAAVTFFTSIVPGVILYFICALRFLQVVQIFKALLMKREKNLNSKV